MPKQVSAGLMFGTILSIPVPDVDRSDHLLILGANPLVSNGSLTAPDMRASAVSASAEARSWWSTRASAGRGRRRAPLHPPRHGRAPAAPDRRHAGGGGTRLAGRARRALQRPRRGSRAGARVPGRAGGAGVRDRAGGDPPHGKEVAAAERAAVYAASARRPQEFGTLASWLVDVLNVLTGNLDREGGAMFTRRGGAERQREARRGQGVRWAAGTAACARPGLRRAARGLLAEEIDTPGEGQVRADHGGGQPGRVDAQREPPRARSSRSSSCSPGRHLRQRDDPPRGRDSAAPEPLQKSHYDLALYQLAVRDVANFSPAVFPYDSGRPDEWEMFLRIAGIVSGQGPDADVDALDELVARTLAQREMPGRDPEEVLAELDPRRGPERILDLLLRAGPHELTLADLEASPHGVDLGPHRARIPEVLRTASGKVELAPEPIVADLDRLRASLDRRNGGMVLIGRRQLLEQLLDAQPAAAGEGQGPARCT